MILMLVTTFAASTVFNSLLLQFLEHGCGMGFADAKNLLVFVPVIQVGAIVVATVLSKWIGNESRPMLFGA
jgi:Na+/melibiose symporter-like transporter